MLNTSISSNKIQVASSIQIKQKNSLCDYNSDEPTVLFGMDLHWGTEQCFELYCISWIFFYFKK